MRHIKTLFTVLGILLLNLTCAQAEGGESQIAKKIEKFLSDPQKHKNLGADIILFAGKSENYTVVLNPKYMPWIKGKDMPEGSQILLAAFIAGNLQAQIQSKTNQDKPEAGRKAAFKAYRTIQAKDPDFYFAGMEKP